MISLRNFTCEDIAILQNNGYDKYSFNQICDLVDKWQTDKTFDNLYFEMFAIVLNDEIVGSASLYQRSNSIISCGIGIYANYQRKGYASIAYSQLLSIAKEKGYSIAVAQVLVNNIASIALNKKLGFECDNYEYTNKKGNKVYYFIKTL